MSGFQEVREAVLVRNPQPDDVLVLRVAEGTDLATVNRIAEVAATVFPCRVAVIGAGVTIEAFDGVIR